MATRQNVVVGLGRSGLSAARWLAQQGETVVVTDSRLTPPGLAELNACGASVVTHLGGFDLSVLESADRIVLSPGVSRQELIVREALSRGLSVVGDVELFAQAQTAPVVAITGTNGKSTVTTLVAEMAKTAGIAALAGGNLGEPALDLLAHPIPKFFVLELSSYQLESTESLKLTAAAVLNVTADHMDRYQTIDAYASAKARIFEHAALAVINIDDPLVTQMPRAGQASVGFSVQAAAADYSLISINGITSFAHCGRALMPLQEMRLPGRHNAANALAALALGDAMGLPMEAMLRTLTVFAGLPHRSQMVAERGGVRFIDDSKGTNVGATIAAVSGLIEPLVVIAGGDGKGQDFSPLAAAFSGRVRHAVLIGRDRDQLASALAGVCDITLADDMDAAVQCAFKVAKSGDIVLLSPACASLDMFQDYADRGSRFAVAAKGLLQ